MKQLFILFGAAITVAIFLISPELRWYEMLPLSILASALPVMGGIMMYNLIKTKPKEDEGQFVSSAVPMLGRTLYSIIGGIIALIFCYI